MQLAETDSAGNLYVNVDNVRITFVHASSRSEEKNWSGKDVIRVQAYVNRSEGQRLHKGAEFPVESDSSFMDLIGELVMLRKAVNQKYQRSI